MGTYKTLWGITIKWGRTNVDIQTNEHDGYLTLSDMAPGRCAPAWGGAHTARTLEFLPECLNQFDKTLYSSRQAFLTLQNKNWPICYKIGRVLQIFVLKANFWKNWIILSNLNNLVNFHSFILWFFCKHLSSSSTSRL
jgi:hypothetical protein